MAKKGRIKTIVWWESFKPKEPSEPETAVNWEGVEEWKKPIKKKQS